MVTLLTLTMVFSGSYVRPQLMHRREQPVSLDWIADRAAKQATPQGGYDILSHSAAFVLTNQPGSLCRSCIIMEASHRPDGEIGRRSGLKIRRPQGRGGSSPPPGTIFNILMISNLTAVSRSVSCYCRSSFDYEVQSWV